MGPLEPTENERKDQSAESDGGLDHTRRGPQGPAAPGNEAQGLPQDPAAPTNAAQGSPEGPIGSNNAAQGPPQGPAAPGNAAQGPPQGPDGPGNAAQGPPQGPGGPGGNNGPPVVQPDQVLQESGLTPSSVKIGSFTQRAGLKLAAGVGALAIVVTLLIVYKWMSMAPLSPDIGLTLTKDQISALIDANKALHEHALDSASKLFDAIIAKVLLPVFTSILGYIFGARSTEGQASQNSES